MKFEKRVVEPSKDNLFYYGNKNTMVVYGYNLPNCTTYVHGRFAEIGANESKLCLGDAKLYYNYNDGFQRSKAPKVGAIACYNGGKYGHVAIVEQIYNDGTMLISESDYIQKIIFRTRRIKQNESVFGYSLQGFILCPVNFDENESSTKYKIGDKVKFSYCYISSTSNEKILAENMSRNYGTITKIIDNAKNPYLLDNGLCWVRNDSIVDESNFSVQYKYNVGQLVVYSSCYKGNNDVPPNYIDCIQKYGAWQQRKIIDIVGGKNPYKLDNGLFVNDGDIREVK